MREEPKNLKKHREEMAKKTEEEEKRRKKEKRDRDIALRLYNKHYKEEFDKRGRSVARHLVGKLTAHLERDFHFERNNELDEEETKEWAAFLEDAKKGDKQKQKVIADNHCVKEIKSLCYVPAKWRPGFEPTEKELLSKIACLHGKNLW